MERVMSSKVRAHVSKLGTSGSQDEVIFIYFSELISPSVLENHWNFVCDLHDGKCYIAHFNHVSKFMSNQKDFSWFNLSQLIFTIKTKSMDLEVPSLLPPWWHNIHIFQKIRLPIFFSFAPFHLQLCRPNLNVAKPNEVWFPSQ